MKEESGRGFGRRAKGRTKRVRWLKDDLKSTKGAFKLASFGA